MKKWVTLIRSCDCRWTRDREACAGSTCHLATLPYAVEWLNRANNGLWGKEETLLDMLTAQTAGSNVMSAHFLQIVGLHE